MIRVLLALLLLFCANSVFGADPATDVVVSYFRGYVEGVEPESLTDRYWSSDLVAFSVESAPAKLTAQQFANRLTAYRAQVQERGWLDSEITQRLVCAARDDLRFVSLNYVQRFEDGTELPAAVTYIVGNTDGWRIQAVIPVDSGVSIGCK